MSRKQFGKLAVILIMCTSLCFGCKSDTSDTTGAADTESSEETTAATAAENSELAAKAAGSVEYQSDNYTISDTITCTVTLEETSVACDGKGAEFKDGALSITKAGTYKISGTLTDGRIEVNTDKDALVQLILDGVNITSSDYSPLVILQAGETVIYLEDGTANTFTDGSGYYTADTAESTENDNTDIPSAAVYSKADLTIEGNGTLVVNANCNDAITSKDALKILSGTYQVTAADDGLVGKDYVAVADGDINIQAAGDGIKSTKTEDMEKGFVTVESGTFAITAGNDAIQAETYVYLSGGSFNMTTAGGSSKAQKGQSYGGYRPDGGNTSEESASTKGIKAGVDITVNEAVITIDSFDDAFHSNETITVNKGTFTISSGDDAFHADSELVIQDGKLQIDSCYEGLEACNIVVNGGDIVINASDDGINAADADSSESNDNFGAPGNMQDKESSSTSASVTITSGTVYINASGDGLDSNGTVGMSGGTVIIDGPVNDGNGSLDYDSSFNISGGVLITAGSSGMLQAPSTTSSQYSIAVVFDSSQSADSLIHVEDSNGNTIVNYTPSKTYTAAVISTPDLKSGSSYSVYTGGNKFAEVTLSAITMKITSSGASEMTQQDMMGGGAGGGRPKGGGSRGGQPGK